MSFCLQAQEVVPILRVEKDQRAPYQGVLMDEISFRKIDYKLQSLALCETKLEQKETLNLSEPSLWESKWFYFVGGVALGAVFISSMH